MPEPIDLYRLLRSAARLDPHRATQPKIGDTVIDTSRWNPDPTMIGVLEAISDDAREGRVYYVRSLDGESQRWVDCTAVAVAIPTPE